MAQIERQKEESRNRELTQSRQGSQAAPRAGFEPFSFTPGEFFSNPFSIMRRMHEEMDRVFAESFGGRSGSGAFGGGLGTWAPTIEISERDNEMRICAELPGLRPEDVKVEVTEDALVIEGERKQEHEDKQEGRWRSERRYGRFHRTIPLPDGANAERARADFKDGELQVTIPVQRPEGKRRQIPIGGAGTEKQTK
jgi:HSP20 family protein